MKGKPGPKNVEDKNAKKGQTHVKKITKGKKTRDTKKKRENLAKKRAKPRIRKKNENEADETKKYA